MFAPYLTEIPSRSTPAEQSGLLILSYAADECRSLGACAAAAHLTMATDALLYGEGGWGRPYPEDRAPRRRSAQTEVAFRRDVAALLALLPSAEAHCRKAGSEAAAQHVADAMIALRRVCPAPLLV